MVNATKSDKIIAIEAPIGIGAIYGPIKPETKAIGNTDAITVNVAKMVGFPTSLIAYKAACLKGKRFILKCLCIFSAIIIESSTTIPVTKTKAKSVILFRV